MTFKRKWTQDIGEWVQTFRSSTNGAKRMHRKFGNTSLAEKCLGRIYVMARKVASAFREKNACANVVAAATSFKDSMWWANLRDYKMCDDATNESQWKHSRRGRRPRQWDEIMTYAWGHQWKSLLCDQHLPEKELKTFFIKEAFHFIEQINPAKLDPVEISLKLVGDDIARDPAPPHFQWDTVTDTVAVHIVGDSNLTVNLVNGFFSATGLLGQVVQNLHLFIHEAWKLLRVKCRTRTASLCSHVYREFNKTTDCLATMGLHCNRSFINLLNQWPQNESLRFVEAHFDGGVREGRSGYGFCVRAASRLDPYGVPMWRDVASVAGHIDNFDRCSSSAAEMMACSQALAAVLCLVHQRFIQFSPSCLVVMPTDFTHWKHFDGIAHF